MLADRLARYGRGLRSRDLPDDVVHEVKRRMLDSLGCALGAWEAPPCRIARRLAESVAVPGGATIWGSGHRTLPDLAAFANGALVRYLDFNDTYLSREPAHPSDNIAAALAAGEAARASGMEVIQAIALAYEVQCRLCDAAALRPRGWDHVTFGPFSSALAAAKVMKLSAAQTLQAVNLAGAANVALRQTRVGRLSMWKACAFSNAARNGVFAAMLAQQGMTGPSPIFEGEKGFMTLVSGPFDLPPLGGERQGSRRVPFKILETYVKHYPVEYHAQTAVEAALELRRDWLETEGAGAIARVTSVTIDSYDVAIDIIGHDPEQWAPRTRETADHSFPYCVAAALLDGNVTVRSFDAGRLRRPELLALMRTIRVRPLREFVGRYPGAMPTRITLRTGSGRVFRRQVDYPLGHPKQPMSDAQVEEKFRLLADGRLSRKRTDRLIELVWQFDRVQDVRALAPLMTVSRRT